jgi:RNA polymerase sigma-70 factor, ECF subfamily
MVALNRAVAVAEVFGAEAALAEVDALNMDHYYLFHAVRAELLRRVGRGPEALAAYEKAAARTANPAERAFLARRIEELAGDAP